MIRPIVAIQTCLCTIRGAFDYAEGVNAEPVQHSNARIILTAEERVPALDQLVTTIKVGSSRVVRKAINIDRIVTTICKVDWERRKKERSREHK
jgi:hypothetical protein